MTREKAHRILSNGLVNAPSEHEWCIAFDAAIKALEQKPSKDCVDRANLLKTFEDRFIELQKAHKTDIQLGVNWCTNTLKDMSSVTPQPKMGKWTPGDPICPCCGEDKFKDLDADIWSDWLPKYCPNCGAEMVESEDKK